MTEGDWASPPSPNTCTEACRARVECTACHRIKAPRGRSVAMEMANGMCTVDCDGYHEDPQVGHPWPNEAMTEEETDDGE